MRRSVIQSVDPKNTPLLRVSATTLLVVVTLVACSGQDASRAVDAVAAGDAVNDVTVSDLDGASVPDAVESNDVSLSDVVPSDADADMAESVDIAADTAAKQNCPSGPGCACKANNDCDISICLDTPDGQRCARHCVEDCPSGFKCATVSAGGGDAVTICVPSGGRLCNPCMDSKECEALGINKPVCVSHGAAGAFCGVDCSTSDDCPSGYDCSDVKAIEGQGARQCVPSPGSGAPGQPGVCTCSDLAVTQKLSTACSVKTNDAEGNFVGNCAGQRACVAAGLSACQAPPASVEACNGLDDDCDGATDEASCDDQNPCTVDICDPNAGPKLGCSHTDTTASCDADASLCTEGDKCKDGLCLPGPAKKCDDSNACTLDSCAPKTGCTKTPDDGAPCDDENPCTQSDTCKAGSCATGTAKLCSSGDTCVEGKCNLTDGKCKFNNKVDGLSCDDGTVCTKADVCKSGQCLGKVASCDDDNPCTDDGCDAVNGCSQKHNNLPCSDGNACTVSDSCINGGCKPGSAKTCDDGNPCTADSCDTKTGACAVAAVSQGCSDNNACTQGDACQSGVCTPGISKPCDDKNPCTTDSCDAATGGCLNMNNAKSCDDGNACTIGDVCTAGGCKSGSAKVCADADTCTADACASKTGKCAFSKIIGCGGNCTKGGDCEDNNPCSLNSCQNGKCAFPPKTAPCSDGDPCTESDLCSGGSCKSGALKSCDDSNPCTDDTCAGALGTCKHVANAASCTDGDACTTADTCAAGKCKPGVGKACGDGNPCTEDGCDGTTGKCVAVANAKTCDDGDPCTVGDTCLASTCHAGVAKSCDDSNPCTNDACDKISGACTKKANTISCDDKNACTQGDICALGACKSGAPKTCDDKNPCTDDACNVATGACTSVANTKPCSDGDACTIGDKCAKSSCQAGPAKVCDDGDACTNDKCHAGSGQCLVAAIIGCGGNCAKVSDCDDSNVCTNDLCSAGKCQFPSNTAACSDNNGCTLNDVCTAGSCKPGAAKNCDDKNPCTSDACLTKTGACQHVAASGSCDDGNPCTTADACGSGSCQSGKPVACDDNQPCTTDKCDTSNGKCLFVANTLPCSDGSACTLKDACQGGTCKSGPTKTCDDNNPCTNDACDPSNANCKNVANGAACSDNNKCTGGDLCVAKVCKPGALKSCADGNPCTKDSCVSASGLCANAATTDGCTDGNPCTVSDVCSKGACQAGAPKSCSDGKKCTADSCDPSSGKCVFKPIIGCGGNCAKVSDCNDGNPCTDNKCTAGKCAFPANTMSCTDGNACTVKDACKKGSCVTGPIQNCDDANSCTKDGCSASSGCTHLGLSGACSDGDACTTGDVCKAAKCAAGGATSCDDGSVCTIDACDSSKGCTHALIKTIYKDCEVVADQKIGGDGVYCIDPDGAGGQSPVQTVCDVTGGGWTLMIHRTKYINAPCKLHTLAAVGHLTSTTATSDAKLDDHVIKAFAQPVYRFDGGYSQAPISQFWHIKAPWTSKWTGSQSFRCTLTAGDWPISWSKPMISSYPLGNTTCKGAKYSTIWWYPGQDSCAYLGDPAGWQWRNLTAAAGPSAELNFWVRSGACKANSDCNDKNPCTDDACDLTTKDCTYTFKSANVTKCDDGDLCTTDECGLLTGCVHTAIKPCCGNAKTEKGEECDNGVLNSTTPNACRPTCKLAGCGDKIVDSKETCDDGNTVNGDGCFSYCQKEPPCPTVKTCAAGSKHAAVFTSSKALQSFVVPAGVTCIAVKVWAGSGGLGGAGGGGGAYQGGGGGGGFSGATGAKGIVVTPGETLSVIAGGVGATGPGWCGQKGAVAGGWGGARGGGTGGAPKYCGWDSSGGGGGGASYVARGAQVLLIAGGGGGGGGGGGNGGSWAGKGAGGGSKMLGGLGKCGQTSLGACASHIPGVSQATADGKGSAGKAGPDHYSAGTGGGGGGWLGGWGASYYPSTGAYGGGGGGAGKSCGPTMMNGAPGTESASASVKPASGEQGNAKDADFSPDGGNGRVVIRW